MTIERPIREKTDLPAASSLRIPAVLSTLLGALALTCTLAGLFVHGFYHLVDPVLLPGSYGQDWTSLAGVPTLAWAVRSARQGSLRGLTVWLGLLTYYTYAYALYTFGPQHTPLYPLYVVILSLSVFASVNISLSLDVSAFYAQLHDRLPIHLIILLVGTIVIVLTPVWVTMMIAAIHEGKPSLFSTIHVLDLAFVFPALTLTAAGLWQRRPSSYVWAGVMLVLSATMMVSLVVSEVIAVLQFTPDPLPLSLTFAVMALAASLLTGTYLRNLAA